MSASLPGVGHFAPVLAPELVATELIRFFEAAGNQPPGDANDGWLSVIEVREGTGYRSW